MSNDKIIAFEVQSSRVSKFNGFEYTIIQYYSLIYCLYIYILVQNLFHMVVIGELCDLPPIVDYAINAIRLWLQNAKSNLTAQ